MPLFIDRFPFHSWTDQTRRRPKDYWSVVLPIVLSKAKLLAPVAGASPELCVLILQIMGKHSPGGDIFYWLGSIPTNSLLIAQSGLHRLSAVQNRPESTQVLSGW